MVGCLCLFYFGLRVILDTFGEQKMIAVNQQQLHINAVDDDFITVQLKDGRAIHVKLDELKQFLDDNRNNVVFKKLANMGKRRV